MKTLSQGAGYLYIDHRDSPGLTPSDVAHVPGALVTPGGMVGEADTKQCSHCQRGVLLNPGRVRARAICHKCYAYICDGCEAMRVATGVCIPFKQVMDTAGELFVKAPDAVVDLSALMQEPRPLALASGVSVDRETTATTEVGD
jgi:hypothetical protein